MTPHTEETPFPPPTIVAPHPFKGVFRHEEGLDKNRLGKTYHHAGQDFTPQRAYAYTDGVVLIYVTPPWGKLTPAQ